MKLNIIRGGDFRYFDLINEKNKEKSKDDEQNSRNLRDKNESGSDYIYMAFAEHPFVSSEGVPVTAK